MKRSTLNLNGVAQEILTANQEYKEMSDTYLWQGAEYFLTVSLAKRLWKLKGIDWASVETPLNKEWFQFKRGRTPSGMRRDGRVDLCLWRSVADDPDDFEIVAPIEVKSSVAVTTCKDDFRRLCHLVQSANCPQGIFAYFWSTRKTSEEQAREALNTRHDALCKAALEIALEVAPNALRVDVSDKENVYFQKHGEHDVSGSIGISIGFYRI